MHVAAQMMRPWHCLDRSSGMTTKLPRCVFVAALSCVFCVGVAQASSSVNGAPGRADSNKRKSERRATPKLNALTGPVIPTVTGKEESTGREEAPSLGSEERRKKTEPDSFKKRTWLPKTPPVTPPSADAQERTEPVASPVTIEPAQPAAGNLNQTANTGDRGALLASTREAPARKMAPPDISPASVSVAYDAVLTTRQRQLLAERADVLKVAPTDYDQLLTADEKMVLQQRMAERATALAGE
jgi:hypothetical protein